MARCELVIVGGSWGGATAACELLTALPDTGRVPQSRFIRVDLDADPVHL